MQSRAGMSHEPIPNAGGIGGGRWVINEGGMSRARRRFNETSEKEAVSTLFPTRTT